MTIQKVFIQKFGSVNENEYSVHFNPRKTFDLRDLHPRFSCCPYNNLLQRIEF